MLTRRSLRVLTILGIVVLAAFARTWAAVQLPVDYDEPDYVGAGYGYAAALRAGNLTAVIDYPENREHPPLVKVSYGLAILALGDSATWSAALYAARAVSALWGVLAVLLLACLDPLAGAFLAVHTLAVKYTSQAYLEALPLCAAVAAVLALNRSRGGRDRWFWLSAAALGATAAGRFTYFPVIFPILYLAIWERRTRWHDLLLYGGVAAATFVALNPMLWHDSLSRLADQLFFHVRYSQGANVQRAGYPWLQPLVWMSRPVPWHPLVFLNTGVDAVVFWAALAGLYFEWHRRRWVAIWIVGAIVVLLLWPTKWPQYALAVVPALCLAAVSSLRWAYGQLSAFESRWHILESLLPRPTRAFWIVCGVMVAALATGMMAHSVRTALGRAGWSHLTAQTSPLPGNTVHVIVAVPPNQMALGTDRGLVLWSPPAAADLPDQWRVFTAENSGLPGDDVLTLAYDARDTLWIGTASGLGRYDGTAWQAYRANDMGLRGDTIHALGVGSDGRLWIGSNAGAASFDGQRFTPYTTANSGLTSDHVLSLVVAARANGDVVWFGTLTGVSRFDTASGQWTSFTAGNSDLGEGGVAHLALDSRGELWASTLGGGLSHWDGQRWQSLRTSNSGIPNNTVQAAAELEPGVLWVATALPLDVGGKVSRYDGTAWQTYTPSNSGYSGAEPLALARDHRGRIWIGTQTAGVEILQLRR